jgi:hypothetical protein
MRILIVLLALAAALASPQARAETYFKTAAIQQMCDLPGAESAAIGKRNICAFYLLGVSDALITSSLYAHPESPLKSTLCWPDDVALATVTDAFGAFTKAHAARADESAALIAAEAFRAKHGCGFFAPKKSKPDVVFFSAGDLMQKCTDASAVTGLYCLYYVIGVSDLYAALATGAVKGVPAAGFANQICYKSDMADDQPKKTFIAYMQAHAAAQGDNAALTAARALHQAFPCR